jgi:hypothetical protein
VEFEQNKPTAQRPLIDGFAAETYQTNALLIFRVLRKFFSLQDSIYAQKEIATRIHEEVPLSSYKKYVRPLCLRFLFELIQESKYAYKPISPFHSLSKEELFAIVLTDAYSIPADEIAAASNTSVGTIQTRLNLARSRAFPGSSNQSQSESFFHGYIEDEIPENLKKFDHSPFIQKKGKHVKFSLTAAPWYYKIIFEGLLITTLVLSIVFSVPKMKKIYEFWLERRLDLYSLAEFTEESAETFDMTTSSASKPDPKGEVATPSQANGSESTPDTPTASGSVQIKSETEFAGRESERLSSDKIYRILIKTDSVESTRSFILGLLQTMRYQESSSSLDSLAKSLPGGIIFDLFIPFASYKSFVQQISALGDTKIIITHSKERGQPGKARIKIWLQRT